MSQILADPANRSLTLTFADNKLLPLLLGDHDRHLARIELRILLEVLLARVRHIRMAPDAVTRIRAGHAMAPDRLDIRFERA